jgi:hypothetical protein
MVIGIGKLFLEYADSLGFDLGFQDFEREHWPDMRHFS